MAELQPFNPLASFLGGQAGAQQAQQRDLALERERQSQALGQQQVGMSQELQRLEFMNKAAKALKAVPESQWGSAFQRLEPMAEKVGIPAGTFNPSQLTIENLDSMIAQTDAFLNDPSKLQQLTSSQRDIEFQAESLVGSINPETGQPFTVESARQELIKKSAGISPRAGTITKEERFAEDPELVKNVGSALASIQSSVTEAKTKAKGRGDTAVDLASSEAALPGLESVVKKLKVLSEEATFTLAGKAFNSVAKQLGFSTKGDTARSAMVAMVDNQVLPLLKPIFGAAFTAAEGDRLRNAFLDPDSTPESRKASLDAFLAQMKANVEAKKSELGGVSPSGQEVKTVNWADL